ncbi:MAG: DNA-protecting protein DprA [Planctomycetota bacterium]|nr:MAG: DNA-protecting protein DprA [Planctomycetota bacterium]
MRVGGGKPLGNGIVRQPCRQWRSTDLPLRHGPWQSADRNIDLHQPTSTAVGGQRGPIEGRFFQRGGAVTAIDSDRLAALQLALTPGIGPVLYYRLVSALGSASAALSADPRELTDVDGVSPTLAARMRSADARQRAQQVADQCRELGIAILLPEDPEFPRLLREIPDPPMVLFYRGQWSPSDAMAIAIVGTRGATQYGRSQAELLARSLARAGLTIVSGLARGIDAAAHHAALEAEGRTIAVQAGGIDAIYPPQHRELAGRIERAGVIVGEVPPGAKPKKGMFPQRNRLISGLALGTIVVEAGTRSGALITARLAGEQGREVFAVPGLVTNPRSRGCHQLLRDGAVLVESAQDVLDALGPLVEGVTLSPGQTIRHPAEMQLNEQETLVLQAIGVEPTDINKVIVASGLPVPRVLGTISVLEMKKLIRRISGQLVQRT